MSHLFDFNPPHFNRRRFLASGLMLATTSKLQLAAQSLGASQEAQVCRLNAEQEQGPFYVADESLRSDIVEGKPGVPLTLRLVVMDSRSCKPLPNAAVDIWHCDALGLYSGFTKQNGMGPGGPPPGGPPPDGMIGPPPGGGPGGQPLNPPTDAFTFLRGIQITDATGAVIFQTVFPGYYMGRTNHIHYKVRLGGSASQKTYQAGHTSHTGQLFFPEELAVRLMAQEPYRSHGIHRTTQQEDHVYGDQHGDLSVARVEPASLNTAGSGFRAELIAAVDPTATPGPVAMGGPRGLRR
jgi:protocatechuate 3,4-dioxygenase beta subunit